MAERRSKWDMPAHGAPPGGDRAPDAPPPSGAPPPAGAPPSGAAATAAAAAAKIAATFGKSSDRAPSAIIRHPDFDQDEPDGAFSHDIEINDHRNRYLLTKGQTQQDLKRETGARVYTKGTWYPDRTKARPDEPPLFLHLTADSREALDRGVAAVNKLMAQDLPQLLDDRVHRAREGPWSEEKVFLNMEPLRNFNLRAKIVGPGGLFVKYIQNETRVRTQIKGIGSGYLETLTGQEAEEPMHVHLTGPDEVQLKKATEMAIDLVDALTAEWHKARAALGLSSYEATYSAPMAGSGHWSAAGAPPPPGEAAPPPPPEGAEVPPPPEDDVPPPPPTDASTADPAPSAAAASTPEDEALRQYWKDYVAWEQSFINYHGRRPTKDEGAQDVPPEHRAR
ncbi:hypothetical protein MSPP1_000922 [Malassezia sp. CBS 17886]|nr:hypothetical protein MSPP1_000922 [Malassezia sp. CBS 17886]